MSQPIRLVTFDALHTIVTPRLPIHHQYALVFRPYLGQIDPLQIKASFKIALKQIQKERPSYIGPTGHEGWWKEVIWRTAVGAGAPTGAVDDALPEIVPNLLKRFSSREGYRLFDDVLPTLKRLRGMGIQTGLVSNTDARMVAALEDLDTLNYLDPVLISETEAVEKPEKEIFTRACDRAGMLPNEVVHVGDELDSDYYGAVGAGMSALLLRRLGEDGEGERKEPDEDLTGVRVVNSLSDVVDWVMKNNNDTDA